MRLGGEHHDLGGLQRCTCTSGESLGSWKQRSQGEWSGTKKLQRHTKNKGFHKDIMKYHERFWMEMWFVLFKKYFWGTVMWMDGQRMLTMKCLDRQYCMWSGMSRDSAVLVYATCVRSGRQPEGFLAIMLNFNNERMSMAVGACRMSRCCLEDAIRLAWDILLRVAKICQDHWRDGSMMDP